MLTIFCHPRPFDGHFDIIQRNAIHSFKLAADEVIAMGRNSRQAGVDFHIEQVQYKHDLPVLSDMFRLADEYRHNPILCYCNSDIILPPDFLCHISKVAATFDTFLCVGRRTDVPIERPIQFSAGWWERVEEMVEKHGKLHGMAGIDYFCYRGDVWGEVKPFVLLALFDNWLVGRAIQRGVPVVDMTDTVVAVHQEHGSRRSRRSPAMDYNWSLVDNASPDMGIRAYDLPDVAHIGHCTWKMTADGVKQ